MAQLPSRTKAGTIWANPVHRPTALVGRGSSKEGTPAARSRSENERFAWWLAWRTPYGVPWLATAADGAAGARSPAATGVAPMISTETANAAAIFHFTL